jgi:hypothetical protein
LSGATLVLTPDQVQNWRDTRFRRRSELQVRSLQQALEFVEDVGFCFLFPASGIEMPSLWEAICGMARSLPAHHDDQELGYAWEWKDELPSRGLAYYGKLLRKKPMLISLKLLPHFYALSDNSGELDDYVLEYQDGKLSIEARQVYEALLEHGALPTSHLRRRAGLSGKEDARRFDRAIVELQLGLKIVKTGISDANAWKYCYVYDVLLRHWPDLAQRARAISSQQAMSTLLLTHLHNVGVATVEEVVRLFGWELLRVEELLRRLTERGELANSAHVNCWPGEYLVCRDLIAEH